MTQQTTKHTPAAARSPQPNASPLVAGRDVKGFEFVPPMVDVRGWDVVMANGARLGTVDRILLDTTDKTPRYLAVTPVERTGSLLIPIGVGTLDQGKRQVVLHNLSPATLEKLPLVTDGAITRDVEREVFGAFTGRKASELTQPQWYADPLFDPGKLFGAPVQRPKS